MTNNKLVKLCAAAGIAFGVSACNSTGEKAAMLNLAAAKSNSKSYLDQGVGQALAEEASDSAARIGRDVRAIAVGKAFTECKAKVKGDTVDFTNCQSILVTSRADAQSAPAPRR